MSALPAAIARELEAATAIENQLQQATPTALPDVQPLAPTATPQAPAPTPPASPPAAPVVDWEAKFKTLQGKYNAELPRANTAAQQLAQERDALARENAELKAAKPPATPPVEKPQADPKDVQEFGADLVEMVQKYVTSAVAQIQSHVAGVAAAIETRVGNLERTVQGVSQQTAVTLEDQFYATLKQLVPNWEAINETEAWIQWLDQTDPVYRAKRQAALNVGFERLDAPHVAGVFKAFLAENPPAPSAQPLSQQITPSGAGTPAPVTPQAKPFISQKSIVDFYNEVAKGLWRGREAQQQQIETQINEAVAEGRVR